MSKRFGTVLLIVAAAYSCTNTEEQSPRADAAIEVGGDASPEGGEAAAGASTGGSGGGDAAQDCGPWGSAGADPEPAPLDCLEWADGAFTINGYFDGAVLVVSLGYYPGLGTWTDLKAEVAAELGTLESIAPFQEGWDGSHAFVYVRINPSEGTTGGDVTFDGVLNGLDQCRKTAACPVHRVLHVEVKDGGAVQVSRNSPEMLQRRRMEHNGEIATDAIVPVVDA